MLFLGIALLGVSMTGFLRLEVELNNLPTDMTPRGSIEYNNYDIISKLFPNTVEAIAI